MAQTQALVLGVIGQGQGTGPGAQGSAKGQAVALASFATMQRAMLAGIHAQAFRALRAGAAVHAHGDDHASLMCDLLECDPMQLLAKVGSLDDGAWSLGFQSHVDYDLDPCWC